MMILGLTGSIGMGKTTLASQLRAMGAKVISADQIVHELLAPNGAAVKAVAAEFPKAVKKGVVDRTALGDAVFKDPDKRLVLEAILHPLVVAEETRRALAHKRKGAELIVLDIPLLFETGADQRCDAVVVATAPPMVQKRRVMARAGMTETKFSNILKNQLPDRDKRRLADVVVPTGLGKAYSFRKLKEMLCSARSS